MRRIPSPSAAIAFVQPNPTSTAGRSRRPGMKLTVTRDAFPLAEAFIISRGSRTEVGDDVVQHVGVAGQELDRDDQLEDWCRVRLEAEPVEIERWTPLRHTFTHFELDIRPVAVRVEAVSRKLEDESDRVWHDYRQEPTFGIAAPVMKLIEQLKTSGRE